MLSFVHIYTYTIRVTQLQVLNRKNKTLLRKHLYASCFPQTLLLYSFIHSALPTKAAHLLGNVLLALLLNDGHGVVLKHGHGLPLPLGLSRLAHRPAAALGTVAIPVVFVAIAVPPAPIVAGIASRVPARVEHVVVAVVARAVSAVAVVTRLVAAVAVVVAQAVVAVVAYVAIAILALLVAGSARGIVFIVRVVRVVLAAAVAFTVTITIAAGWLARFAGFAVFTWFAGLVAAAGVSRRWGVRVGRRGGGGSAPARPGRFVFCAALTTVVPALSRSCPPFPDGGGGGGGASSSSPLRGRR
jgi:hypothetical protein